MARVPVSSNQAEEFITKYTLLIVGFLFSLPLLFFGYYKIQNAIALIGDYSVRHDLRLGLLFMTLGIIFLGSFFLVAVIGGRRK